MRHIKLDTWSEFETTLRVELEQLDCTSFVTIRNFGLISVDEGCNTTNRLAIVLKTGSDRDGSSNMWDVAGFDYEHLVSPNVKRAEEIIYAYTIDLRSTPYSVLQIEESEILDITSSLTEADGLIVYDTSMLERKTRNEYWFKTSPMDAVLFVMSLNDY